VLPGFVHVAFAGLGHVAYWEIVVAVLVKADTSNSDCTDVLASSGALPSAGVVKPVEIDDDGVPSVLFFVFVICGRQKITPDYAGRKFASPLGHIYHGA
jgi:hypothetical protein